MNTLVVIPARNEAALIGRCLAAVQGARVPGCKVVVVADSCTDDTAAIARNFEGVEVIEIEVANVGEARRVGIEHGLVGADWIASTDADSVVPENWISEQLRLAAEGTDVVVGTVRPEAADLTPEQLRAWTARHNPARPNGHVHGANLGIRASAYIEAGGFRPIVEHEDVELVERLHGLSKIITPANTAEVVTSGRSFGRTPGGYARYLRSDLVELPAADERIA